MVDAQDAHRSRRLAVSIAELNSALFGPRKVNGADCKSAIRIGRRNAPPRRTCG